MTQLVLERTAACLALRATFARSSWSRMRGLLGRTGLSIDEALIFERSASIHTIGMRFPIDAIFVDREWRVVGLKADLRPGKLVLWVARAWGTIEMASGSIARCDVRIGDHIRPVRDRAAGP